MHPNNPMVSWVTRQWFSRTVVMHSDMLDEPSLALLWPALRACHDKHPGGIWYELGLAMGASEEVAQSVASACELFYVACSLSDDIQDGDADGYMGVSRALQINAQGHLLSLLALRIAQIDVLQGGEHWVVHAYRTLAIMITGQRMELVRDPWTVSTYERVARLSAGQQMAFYAGLTAWSAGVSYPNQSYVQDWGKALGTALQVVWDRLEEDDRLLGLDEAEVKNMTHQLIHELMMATDNLPLSLRTAADRVVSVVCNHAMG